MKNCTTLLAPNASQNDISKLRSHRQSNNPADCCSVLIKTEGCEEEAEVDVEGVEEALLTEGNRESSIETPRRRDSSDPVNLSLNSGTSTTSESSHDVVAR